MYIFIIIILYNWPCFFLAYYLLSITFNIINFIFITTNLINIYEMKIRNYFNLMLFFDVQLFPFLTYF